METIFEDGEVDDREHYVVILTPQEKLHIKKYLEKNLMIVLIAI